MNKKKSLIIKIIACFMIFCMSFLFIGCTDDMSPEDKEEFETEAGEDTGDGSWDDDGSVDDDDMSSFDMYGAKVLYRPEGYDYNAGSGGTDENPNDYYGKYAWWILQTLNLLYGTTDTSYTKIEYLKNLPDANIPYLYDSIRYQVDTIGTVTSAKKEQQKVDGEGKPITNPDGTYVYEWVDATTTPYTIVGADLTSKWNWSFNYDWESIKVALIDTEYIKINSDIYNINSETVEEAKNAISNYYTNNTDLINVYQTLYLGTSLPEDYDNYSQYVKALEYAIYSYALDLEPSEVDVTYHTSGENAYTVTINHMTVDEALNNIKTLFNKVGSYVGLTNRQAEKLKTWVFENIIGYSAQDDFTTYENVTVYLKSDGTTVDHYELGNGTTTNLGRNYQEAVNAIIDGVCSKVTIGNADGDGNGYIDDEFLASEIMEYAGDMFRVSDDDNFSHDPNASKFYLKPMEYQSVTLMLKGDSILTELWIALKYDADNDGTEEGVWDTSKYIDIIVELNYFSYEDQKMFTIGKEQARVYDGPFDPDHENAPDDMYEDRGNVCFWDFAGTCQDPDLLKHLDKDEDLMIGKFNTEIGNKALMTDVGLVGKYKYAPLISNNPLVLTGTSPARRYYTLLEPSADENLEGKTYITGRLNPEKFKGADGCDYLEITYKVLKNHATDTSQNYKFYTGISAMF